MIQAKQENNGLRKLDFSQYTSLHLTKPKELFFCQSSTEIETELNE